jgi:hypothetical protein
MSLLRLAQLDRADRHAKARGLGEFIQKVLHRRR